MTSAARWEQVLDELEAELALDPRAAAADPLPAGSWEPPADLGPLPAALASRATALLARQEERAAELRAALDDTVAARRRTGREHEAARRLGAATRQPAPPVYVDLVG